MRVTVVGTGYVGLVTGACLAEIGHQVVCVDNNESKIEALNRGHIPIYEPGLEDIVRRCSGQTLSFTTDLGPNVRSAEVVFIAVGTPSTPTGEADLRYVEAVAKGIGQHLDGQYRVVVNKSTVPIGSGDWVQMLILDGAAQIADQQAVSAGAPIAKPNALNFDVVSNPEFLREGTAVWDTFNPDRIVVGSGSAQAIELMQRLYRPILDREFAEDKTLGPVPFVVTDLSSAEMIKYAANAFLATKISFINEVANICERVGADVTQVARGMGLDSRIGTKFLNAGLGWGGSCFPKDVSALVHTAADYGYDTKILKAAIVVNESQRNHIIERLQQELKVLKGKTIGLLGLTFKPDTDDMRDAPSLTLIHQLSKLGAKVKAYDPIVSASGIREGLSDVLVETDALRLAQGCDALVLVTEWKEFQSLDLESMANLMHRPVLVDARNFLDRDAVSKGGFFYIGVGR
ncbi:MAG: UDP-glucose/GDP-mannose dehydrogenase family protein [Gloeobacterales cyanobacterium]